MDEDSSRSRLAEEVERIVRNGDRVRERVQDAVAGAASRAARGAQALQGEALAVGRSAVDGAVRALERAVPTEQDSALRKVIEGVADGLVRTAQATNLAMREAYSEGRAFAREDLDRIAGDLRDVRGRFAEVVGSAAKSLYRQGSERYDALRTHVERTAKSMEPALTSALDAVTADPIGTAGEAARAATGLAREGAGVLFRTLGDVLQRVGDRLGPPRSAGAPDEGHADRPEEGSSRASGDAR